MKTETYYRVEYGTKNKRYLNITDMRTWINENTDSRGNIFRRSEAENIAETLREVFKIVRIIEINEKILEAPAQDDAKDGE